MVDDVLRAIAGALSLPVGGLFESLHRRATGTHAVLELRIRHWEQASARDQVLRRLRRVAAEDGVDALYLHIDAPPGSWAATQDLRHALEQVRHAGKKVYVLLESPGNATLWLATAADRVFCVPGGQVGLVGIGAELTFMGDALQRLGVEPDFEAAGAYKSFGEPFTRTHASPANQEATRALVDDLHEQLLEGVARGRGLEVETVRALLDDAPLDAQEALDAGLVDQVAYEDEVHAWIEAEHGEKKRRPFVGWARRDLILEWIESWGSPKRRIAIVHLEGNIVMEDKRPTRAIRARSVVPLLRKLREDDDVKAVVLHVNSPGGSALASDLIWREVALLQKEKPVVASYEDVAASGGVYLAAPAAEILARPGTLTGSIGVFGGKLVMQGTLRQVGVHAQAIAAAPNATVFSPTRPFTDAQRVRFKQHLQGFYDGFVERVAEGRGQPTEAVEPFCRGRVWTGRLALENGLIDAHGDLFDAIDRARDLADLRHGSFREENIEASPKRSLVQRVIQSLIREAQPVGALAALIGAVEQRTATLELVQRHQAQALALLPFELELR